MAKIQARTEVACTTCRYSVGGDKENSKLQKEHSKRNDSNKGTLRAILIDLKGAADGYRSGYQCILSGINHRQCET